MNQFVSGLNAVVAGLKAATAATAQLSVSLKRLSTLEREMVKAPRRARYRRRYERIGRLRDKRR